MHESLDEEELADWRAGRNAVYQAKHIFCRETATPGRGLL